MAVRALTGICLLLSLMAAPVSACFGPKLFVAVTAEPRQQALIALATLYVQEKTGVESELLPLAPGTDPLQELARQRADLVLVGSVTSSGNALLSIPGYPVLIGGERIANDLQFTTVAPALRKFGTLLTTADLDFLTTRVAAGEPPVAAARRLLMDRRWI